MDPIDTMTVAGSCCRYDALRSVGEYTLPENAVVYGNRVRVYIFPRYLLLFLPHLFVTAGFLLHSNTPRFLASPIFL